MKASRGCGEEACSFTSRHPSSTTSNTRVRKASQSGGCQPENPHTPFERFPNQYLRKVRMTSARPWRADAPKREAGLGAETRSAKAARSDLRARLAAIDRHG
jgi:hypothetical protein